MRLRPDVSAFREAPELSDAAIQTLQEHKDAWVKLSLKDRIVLIDKLIIDFAAISARWVDACNQAKGISDNETFSGEEWSIGPWPTLKTLRQLRQALVDIDVHGRPHIPGPVRTLPNGQVSAQVFPYSRYDSILFTGVTAEIWMQPATAIGGLLSLLLAWMLPSSGAPPYRATSQ